MERSGRECVLFNQPVSGARGWHLHCVNTNIGSSAELMAPSTFTYAQNDAEDQIEVVSDSASDVTQYVTVYGIDNSGNKIREKMGVLTGATVVLSANTFRYIENAWMDTEAAGTVTVQDEDNNLIAEIEIGSLNTGICQHFNGESESYITYFRAGMWGRSKRSINFELRWYHDDADCLDASDGYEILDRIMIGGGYDTDERTYNQSPAPSIYPMPIGPLSKGGWICVYATGVDGDTCNGWCTLQGFDIEIP